MLRATDDGLDLEDGTAGHREMVNVLRTVNPSIAFGDVRECRDRGAAELTLVAYAPHPTLAHHARIFITGRPPA